LNDPWHVLHVSGDFGFPDASTWQPDCSHDIATTGPPVNDVPWQAWQA
jgi:hypothetical protein